MPLRLAKYGVPLAETAPAGLAAAGVEPVLLPPAPQSQVESQPQPKVQVQAQPQPHPELPRGQEWPQEHDEYQEQYDQQYEQYEQQYVPQPEQYAAQQPQLAEGSSEAHESPWFAAPQVPQEADESAAFNPTYVEGLEPTPVRVPAGPGRTRPLGGMVPGPRTEAQQPEPQAFPEPVDEVLEGPAVPGPAEDEEFAELAYPVFRTYVQQHGDFPSAEQLDIHLNDGHGVQHPRSPALLRRLIPAFRNRYQSDLEAEHIA
jgi:hypothetical protein